MVSSERFLVALFAAWALTPVWFIVVGIICESRVVPLWRNQSRAFMPGDLALGVTFATGWYLHPRFDPTLLVIGLVAGVVLLCLMRRKFDGTNNYPLPTLRSPTKVYHDYVLYIGYVAALVSVAVPGILMSSWSDAMPLKVIGLIAFVVWLSGLVADGLDPDMPRKRKLMHVSDWRPIWRE